MRRHRAELVLLPATLLLAALLAAPVAAAAHDHRGLVADWLLAYLRDAVLPWFAPTGSTNRQCREHSLLYLDAVATPGAGGVVDNLWALRMLDSSSKLQDGILNGNINWLGNFDECLGVAAPDAAFVGKHCFVAVAASDADADADAGTWLTALLARQIGVAAALRKGADPGNGRSVSGVLPAGVALRVSLCVPSSCSAADVAEHVTSQLAPLGLNGVVRDANCHTLGDNPLEAVDWAAISLLIGIGVLLTLSTLYDLLVPATAWTPREKALRAFSVHLNGGRLLSTTAATSDGDLLSCVNGVRVLSMAWVMYCHRWSTNVAYPSPFLDFVTNFRSDPVRSYILNGTVSVDSFFLLSSCLLTYIFFKEMDKGTAFNWPIFVLQRYLRLTPALAAMVLLQASLLDHAGTGPDWSNSQWDVDACRANWWVTLLYVQNYVHEDFLCLTVSWYLAPDLQLYALSPVLLLVLRDWPKTGRALLGVGVAVGVAHSFTVAYLRETHVTSQGNTSYTHERYTVWLIGIALGYLLHLTKKKPVVMHKATVLALWTLSLFLTFGTVYLMAPFIAQGYQYNRLLDSLYLAYFRAAFAVGLAWVIFACARGFGGFVNTGLSWKFFTPMARLSFGIYLIHLSIHFSLLGSVKVPTYVHDSVVVPQFFGDLVIASGFAAALHLAVEAPCAVLFGLAFRKGAPTKKAAGTAEPILKDTDSPADLLTAEEEVVEPVEGGAISSGGKQVA